MNKKYSNRTERDLAIAADILAQRQRDEHNRQFQEWQDHLRQGNEQRRQNSRKRRRWPFSLQLENLLRGLLAASDPFPHECRSTKARKVSNDESEKDASMEETQGDDERSWTTMKMEDGDEPSDMAPDIPMHQDERAATAIKMEEDVDEPPNFGDIPMYDGDGDATVSRTEFNHLKDRLERLDAKIQMLLLHLRSI